ncbi:2OG-Fe(II) oxygenase superfamily-domain-containing protein [Gloeopeniophorella convolvens]|nr:2OG-Fe(II) oxygenase superfamily-domain-containing protein [Gloeopeniophorella convolvens]
MCSTSPSSTTRDRKRSTPGDGVDVQTPPRSSRCLSPMQTQRRRARASAGPRTRPLGAARPRPRTNDTNLDTHYAVPPAGLWRTFLAAPHTPIPPRVPPPGAVADPPGPRRLIANAPASLSLAAAPKPPPAPAPQLAPATAAQLVPRLRWANIGWAYHWGAKQYDFARGAQPVGKPAAAVCADAVRSVDWARVFAAAPPLEGWGESGPDWAAWAETYEPDAGIVNFYQTKDTLMGHVDRSELCATAPLVSVSLGNAAVFLIGGLTRDVAPLALLLRSGDVVVMAGPACRRAYHGWAPYARYMRTTRINVNVRQVFPRGFDPALAAQA